MFESKKRYKLFKSGKLWCCAAITFGSLIVGTTLTSQNVHADNVNSTTLSTEQVQVAPSDNRYQQAAVKNAVGPDTTTQNNDVNANQGHLDSYQVTTDTKTAAAQLSASGWQVSGQSNAQPYRYAILFDNTTNHEIERQAIAPETRSDVQRVYSNVDNSLQSGFSVNFTLPNNVSGHTLTIISRYSNDAVNGEGQHTDYWMTPIVLNNDNLANLDDLSSDQDGNLHVSGWHASNQALGKRYHYIIAFDQTTGREIARQEVKQGQSRNDVAKVYPTVFNASDSGFDVSFRLTPQYSRDNIQLISRWTDDPFGNGNAVDYWFNPVNKQNRAFLDSWNISSGKLTVSGWHADDASLYQPYHYLILFDNTSNTQVGVIEVVNQTSPDVAKAYHDTLSAKNARFSGSFDNLNMHANHQYSLVSRYSAVHQGNGDDGVAADHTDYWFNLGTLNQQAANIDSVVADGQRLTVSGWIASDDSLDDRYPYLIVLADGQEVARQQLVLQARPDVAKVYPQVYNSGFSGFSTTITLPETITGDLQFVLRFSNDGRGGEGHRQDQWSNQYTTNAGNFDGVTSDGKELTVSGWHAASGSLSKQYEYLFVMDANTNQELWRVPISGQETGQSRPDVYRVYPWIANSSQSGFKMTVAIPQSITGREIRLMHRYTDDEAGNGNSEDYYDNNVYFLDGTTKRLLVNQFKTFPDSKRAVYFANDGRRASGNVTINGTNYYFDPSTGKLLRFDGRTEKIVNWFRSREGRLTYSMDGSRNGADGTADCSGSMVQALHDASGVPYDFLYDTETMHEYVQENGYYLAGEGRGRMQVQYGDIVIWGSRGHSSGSFGHTVIVSTVGGGNNLNCISTCGYDLRPGQAVKEFNYYSYWASDGYPYQYIYRPY